MVLKKMVVTHFFYLFISIPFDLIAKFLNSPNPQNKKQFNSECQLFKLKIGVKDSCCLSVDCVSLFAPFLCL